MRYLQGIKGGVLACILNISTVCIASDGDNASKQIQMLNSQIQTQLQQMQESQQKQIKDLNVKFQAQLQQMQTNLEAEIQKANTQNQAQFKQIQENMQKLAKP